MAPSVPIPGEDGTPQTVSETSFYFAIGLVGLAILGTWLYWAIKALFAYLAARGVA